MTQIVCEIWGQECDYSENMLSYLSYWRVGGIILKKSINPVYQRNGIRSQIFPV